MFSIEATSDTHFPVKPEMFKGADVLVVAGDLMMRGDASEGYPALDAIAALPHQYKIIVGGNHDRMFDPASKYAVPPDQIEDTYPTIIFLGYPFRRRWVYLFGRKFVGLPFVTNLPNWAFNRDELDIKSNLLGDAGADVLITHSPPMFHRDGGEIGQAWGVAAYLDTLYTVPPFVWICGHIHESYGHTTVLGVDLYNVAMCDEHYNVINKPVIIQMMHGKENTNGKTEATPTQAEGDAKRIREEGVELSKGDGGTL